jgi:hypothetical protein
MSQEATDKESSQAIYLSPAILLAILIVLCRLIAKFSHYYPLVSIIT